MIEKLYIDELEYSIIKGGTYIDDERYSVEVHKDHSIFSCENLHDEQKVELFLQYAGKLTLDELEKRLHGSVKKLKEEITELKDELLDANEEIRDLEYQIV